VSGTEPTRAGLPKKLPERAQWAKARPARRFRIMMEPVARAILAEQERDEAEGWSARWKTLARRYRSMLAIHRDRWSRDGAAVTLRSERDELAVELAEYRAALQAERDARILAADTTTPGRWLALERSAARIDALLAREPGALGREVLEAGNAMAEALGAIGDWDGCEEIVVRDSTRSKHGDEITHQIIGSDLVRMALARWRGALEAAPGDGEVSVPTDDLQVQLWGIARFVAHTMMGAGPKLRDRWRDRARALMGRPEELRAYIAGIGQEPEGT
jgi:hypothetical protein